MMGRLCDECAKPATWVVRDIDPLKGHYADACDKDLGEVAAKLYVDTLAVDRYIFPTKP